MTSLKNRKAWILIVIFKKACRIKTRSTVSARGKGKNVKSEKTYSVPYLWNIVFCCKQTWFTYFYWWCGSNRSPDLRHADHVFHSLMATSKWSKKINARIFLKQTNEKTYIWNCPYFGYLVVLSLIK